VLVGWAADYLARQHGLGDSLADDRHTARTFLPILCRPALDGQHPARTGAAGIAGDRGSLSRDTLRRLAFDATIDPVSLAGPDQDSHGHRLHRLPDPIDLGRRAAPSPAGSSRALVTRDRHCIVKGCHRRPAQCAAHHVRHEADGGPHLPGQPRQP